MYERVLWKMREKIRQRDYVVTTHADEEMYEDGLTIWDVEAAVLAGEIIERQRDHRSGEWKYVIQCTTSTGASMAVVAKFGYTEKVVIITVYRLEA
jgi:hypothetical protein